MKIRLNSALVEVGVEVEAELGNTIFLPADIKMRYPILGFTVQLLTSSKCMFRKSFLKSFGI